MFSEHKEVNPVNTATVLKALLMGFEIETHAGTFKYFRKGDWMPLPNNEEGEVAEEGVFKKSEVIHHTTHLKNDTLKGHTEYRWLLWLSSLGHFVHWTETIGPKEMAIICANLALNKDKIDFSRPMSELLEEIEL